MIFRLPILEDFCFDISTRRIVCIGIDYKARIKISNSNYKDKIDYAINLFSNCNELLIRGKKIQQITFRDLLGLSTDEYILLITSTFIDIAKDMLLDSLPEDIDFICYHNNLLSRIDYASKPYKYRIEKPAVFWLKKCRKYNKDKISVDKQFIMPRIVYPITTFCNLSCCNCIALIKHYTKPEEVNAALIIEDINVITSIIDFCACFEIIGGEPFLHNDLDKILLSLIQNEKVGMVQVTTNGLVYPNDKILNVLLHPKIEVRVSDYGENIEKTAKLIRVFEDKHIHFRHYTDLSWRPIGKLNKLYKEKEYLKDEYAICYEGLNCKTLFKGKLFSCTFAKNLWGLQINTNSDYLDIKDLLHSSTMNEIKIILKEWLCRQTCSSCDYCNLMDWWRKDVPAGKQENISKSSTYRIISRAEYKYLQNFYIKHLG